MSDSTVLTGVDHSDTLAQTQVKEKIKQSVFLILIYLQTQDVLPSTKFYLELLLCNQANNQQTVIKDNNGPDITK